MLFAKLSEPETTVIDFDDHFRGHIEVFPKLWNLRPYDKTNGQVTRIPRLTAAEKRRYGVTTRNCQKLIPEFLLIRRMLLGADAVFQIPRLTAFEANERRLDRCFVGRNAAVLQYTQFVYRDETTRTRMNNTASPKPGQFDEEWAKLDLAPMVMRGKADLPEASLILTSVKPELTMGGTLQTTTTLAPFGSEEFKVVHGEEEDQSAGRLVIPKFPDRARD